MAQVEAYVNYIAPVAGTKEELVKIDRALAANPLIVPPADVLARAQVFRGLSAGRGDEVLQDVRVDHGGLMVDTGKGDLVAGRAHEVVRVVHRGAAARPHHRGGLVLRAARPVGLRQDDDAADDRGSRRADERSDPHR